MAEDKDGKNGESKGELTKSEPKPALVASGNRNVGAIIPENIEQAFRLAQAVCAANMAPKAYNRDVNAVMVGMLHGMEVGLTPMASLQSIAVINGMPTIWGDGALALVRSSGLLEDFDERMEGDGDEMAAVCELKRKGEKSKKIERFSVARAKKAGLWGKAGPWTQYPERMLQMRARSFALRDKFADVLRGLHVAEEVRDMGELVPGQDGTYAPQRPLREKYLDEDYQRRMDAARKRSEEKQAEEDEARMNNEARGAMGGHTLADEAPSSDGPGEAATPAGGNGEPAGPYEFADHNGELTACQAHVFADLLEREMRACKSPSTLEKLWSANQAGVQALASDEDAANGPEWADQLARTYAERKDLITPKAKAETAEASA